MSTFRWLRPRSSQHLLPIINVKGEARVIVCAPPSAYAIVCLHFLGRGSVPCLDDACKHCGISPPEIHAYTPALQVHPSNGEWVRIVLDLGNPHTEAASRDLRNQVVTLQRKVLKDDSYTGLRIKDSTPLPHAFAERFKVDYFDVRGRLEQRWGLASVSEVQPNLPLEVPAKPGEEIDTDDANLILPFVGKKSA